MQNAKREIWEDVWLHTQCSRCYNDCGIQVHRVNGVAVEIQGVPDSTHGAMGGLCSKGLAGLQVLYDPNRLNTPLRRTNPEKGIGVDPKWKKITWEEAYDEIVPRLKKLLEEDPRKVSFGQWGGGSSPSWSTGTPSYLSSMGPYSGFVWGGGLQCGGASHPIGGITHGSWSVVPDFKYSNYVLYFGASKGHAAGHSAMITARMAAEARARGMKMIVFDPMCRVAASKAFEWVPIVPGTDGAVILAMCNIIVNELGIIDKPFLKMKTNAPYLVGPDMKYVRENGPARGVKGHRALGQQGENRSEEITYIGDDETNKPMVWDVGEGKAKVYDDPTIKDYALEGNFEYRGIKCQPSFQLLKEHLKEYTTEMASKVSSIPPETIRRIATDFAHEARVGSTININGHILPYRPVAAIIFRGGEGHGNAYHTCFAVSLISALVGAVETPGGTTGWPARTLGFPGREEQDPGGFKWSVFKGLDGFLQNQRFGPGSGRSNKDVPYHGEWPIPYPEWKHQPGLIDIQPAGRFKYIVGGSDRDEVWKKLGATYPVEMMFISRNPLMSIGDRDALANALKSIKFVVVSELFNTETSEGFADIVLPDGCYLEKDSWHVGLMQNFNHAWGMDDWSYHITQTIAKPTHQRKSADEVTYDLAVRLGKELGRNLVREANERFLRTAPISKEYWPNDLDRYLTAAELGDAFTKSTFGPEHGWDWFKKHGFMRWPKRVEEAYWLQFLPMRIPVIYLEWLAHMKPIVEDINQKTGVFMDPVQYTPLISWFPCTIHKVEDPEYDLYCYSYRDILHSSSQTMEQPWLDEASQMNPWTYNITMNAETGRKKGLKDGDLIEVETYLGRKEKGTVKLMAGHHPLTVGISSTAGHFAKGQPIAFGKGSNFNTLLPMTFEHTDPVAGNLETCVRVTVRKIDENKEGAK
ncbi:MAG: molybdopterin-dependent oxidoreductase [Chloroflexi bacterium]|nr:molybdopterin-dependent oxidoreductase [Chloroflexota bacterium]